MKVFLKIAFFIKIALIIIPVILPGRRSHGEVGSECNESKDKKIENMVIIGSGPAGLSAAIYAARANLNPIIIEGETGGQISKASQIENWPGINSILGSELATNIKKQAEELGTRFISSFVTKVNFLEKPFTILTQDNKKILANSVVISTGSKPAKLNCPGEEKYLGKGVAICATCDAPLFKNKPVVVIGGNYSALRETIILNKYTDKITILNRKPTLEGPLLLLHPVTSNPNIKILNNHQAIEIMGKNNVVDGIKTIDLETQQEKIIPAKAVFIAIGSKPLTEIFSNQLKLDEKNRIKTSGLTKTSIDGIFAAGDVTDKVYHQAPIASTFGYIAAMEAENYLRQNNLF